MNNKDLIINRLKSFREIENVNVRIGKQKSTIHITYPTKKSLDFKFNWQDDHFIGYFIDDKKTEPSGDFPLEAKRSHLLCYSIFPLD